MCAWRNNSGGGGGGSGGRTVTSAPHNKTKHNYYTSRLGCSSTGFPDAFAASHTHCILSREALGAGFILHRLCVSIVELPDVLRAQLGRTDQAIVTVLVTAMHMAQNSVEKMSAHVKLGKFEGLLWLPTENGPIENMEVHVLS